MSTDLPADIDSTIQSFLAGGRYQNEAEVLREALAALKYRDEDLEAIQAGIDDMKADRISPWEEAKARIETKLGPTED